MKEEEALAACAHNGQVVEGHTIRVDMALDGKKHDQKKAIFLGNLHFSTKEDDVKKVFEKCGEILDVRLVRDSTTGKACQDGCDFEELVFSWLPAQ